MNLVRYNNRLKAVIDRLLLSDALRAKTVRGGVWLGAGSIAEQAVRFARNMLLARLLAPGAFGTMAIVVSSASLVDTLTDVGVRAAIIQNPRGDRETYLNASWWLGFGRALLSYAVIFVIAPWIARFYGRAELSGLLRVALLGVLFNGSISPHSALAQRQMKLGRWAVITNGGGICGVILAVVLSFFLRDVWALAIGYCSENFFRSVLSYSLCPGLPSRWWNRDAARDLLTFSRGIFGLTFLNLIVTRADIFVLAKLYSSAALGLYTMAVALVITPSFFLTNMLGQALLPALSSVQEDTERLNRILVEVSSWVVSLGMPVAVCVSLCAPSLLSVIYGTRYVAAAGALAVASAVVLLTALNALPTGVLLARGRPGLHRESVAATAAIMVVAIYPASRFMGTMGGQLAALLAIAAGYMLQLVRLCGSNGLNPTRYGRIFVTPTLGSLVMLGVVLGIRHLGLATSATSDIALCLGGCGLAYAMLAWAHVRPVKRPKNLCIPGTPESPRPFDAPTSRVSL